MTLQTPIDDFHVTIVGSRDFVRRMSAAALSTAIDEEQTKLHVSSGNMAEAKSLVLTNRPHVLVLDIGFKTTKSDIAWLKGILRDLRERFGKKLYIIAAVSSPRKFALAGDLLFADSETLAPSGFLDNYVIAPPPGVPSVPSLENQLQNCLQFVIELLKVSEEGYINLPAMWDANWVPTMCDQSSRAVWMRWLPRYASYVNENPLVVGPTGSGKTRLAAALHALSGRTGPFVSITPRDFSSTELVQAELFGAVSGAYTGAVEKWGLVRKADQGTLFIDELQSIDFDLQGKLITFIENKTYRRVGEAESHQADVRFVFASNRSLQSLVDEGKLRDDFAYRLERLRITLTPLHERQLDISAGICFALAKVLRERAQSGSDSSSSNTSRQAPPLEGITTEAYRHLFGARWPGNLRQLENSIARLIELSSIRNRSIVDEECTEEALQGLLGQHEVTGSEVFSRAAEEVLRQADARGFENLRECSNTFVSHARRIALETTGGEIEKAASLINDSEKALSLFVASRVSPFDTLIEEEKAIQSEES